jgi:hypothetical protein
MAYSDEQKDQILNDIFNQIEEGKSLRKVLSEPNTITRKTFFEWIDLDKNKINQYARACEIRAEKIFDEMLDIADDGTNDFMSKMIAEDVEIQTLNSEHIQRSKLRIDTRKWTLSKMNPKKYGDKLETKNEHSGEITITRIVKK